MNNVTGLGFEPSFPTLRALFPHTPSPLITQPRPPTDVQHLPEEDGAGISITRMQTCPLKKDGLRLLLRNSEELSFMQ